MADYQYEAFDQGGGKQTGVISASSPEDAQTKIRALNLYPSSIVELKGSDAKKAAKQAGKSSKSSKGKVGGKIKPKTLMIFTRQLATLIDAGLPLLRSLNVLAKQEPNPVLKSTINSLADSVQGGATFSEALAQHPRIFNKLYVNMVKAGELGGVLELVLTRLAEYQEKAQKLYNKVKSAMTYPLVVLFLALGIMTFLMLVMVPKFQKMFVDMNVEMPAFSQLVFGVSEFLMDNPLILPNAVWAMAVVAVLIFVYVSWGKTSAGRAIIDTWKLRIPVFGNLVRQSSIARFTRTLGTLVSSGVPILQALNITRETAGNIVIANAIGKVHDSVKEGEAIITPMIASKVFPPMMVSMVDVGEETGQLPEMLLKVSDVYDDEVDNSVSAMTSLMEPLMIVFLALIVGSIVIALFLPMVELLKNAGQ